MQVVGDLAIALALGPIGFPKGTARFDDLAADGMDALAVSGDEIDAALDGLTPDLRDALETAAARIRGRSQAV